MSDTPPKNDAPSDLGLLQRVDVLQDGRVVLTLWSGERSLWSFSPTSRTLSAIEARPEKAGTPPAVQKRLREHLAQSVLSARDDVPSGARWRFRHKNGSSRILHFEHLAALPRVVLCQQKARDGAPERIVCVVGSDKDPQRNLRKGQVYIAPEPSDAAVAALAYRAEPDAAPPEIDAASAANKQARLRLRKEKKRLQRLLNALARDARKLGSAQSHYEAGEALKGLLDEVAPGQRAVTAPHTGLVIELDPARSPHDNLERIFRLAKRAKRGQAKITARRDETQRALDALEAFLDRTREQTLTLEDASDYLKDARRKQQTAAPRVRPQRRQPYRRFERDNKPAIFVGRSAKDNDTLTFHVARGRDTWLHARGYRGSHVVIKCNLEALDADQLIDAAHLAAHFSDARGQTHIDVTYTERKNVKKPGKNAAAGMVILSKERVVHINLDPVRLAAVLKSEVAADR